MPDRYERWTPLILEVSSGQRAAGGALPRAWHERPRSKGASLLAPLPTHHPAKAQNLIMIFLTGGFSHVDTFDYKPAPDPISRQVGPEFRPAERRDPRPPALGLAVSVPGVRPIGPHDQRAVSRTWGRWPTICA